MARITFAVMEISDCISELLIHSDSVVIPTFGILKSQEVSAAIHPGENSFRPPNKKISFEAVAAEEDDVLAKCVEQKFRTSQEESIEALKIFVKEINDALHATGAYELKGIGKFYYDIEKHLQFTATPSKNFLLSSFGLPEFVSKPILRPENIPTYSVIKQAPEKKKRKFIWFRF
jgi:nucleoid DNA-binding protein